MRGFDETDLEYWTRRHSEVMALAENADGELREAHLALAGSYARLIDLANGSPADAVDWQSGDPR